MIRHTALHRLYRPAAILLLVPARLAFSQDDPATEGYQLENPITVEYLQTHLEEQAPRLVLNAQIEERLRDRIQTDPVVQNMYEALRLNANDIQSEPLLERELTGRRLLSVSREMLYRMNVLGMVYRMDRDRGVLDRINEELLASVISLDPPPMALDRRIENLKRIEVRVPAYLFSDGKGSIRVRLSADEP